MSVLKEPGRTRRRTAEPSDAPDHHNMRFRIVVASACILMIALAIGFVIYRLAFNTVEAVPEPRFDLSSLIFRSNAGPSAAFVDVGNPAIAVQEHLELLRRKDYTIAYKDLSSGLHRVTPLEQFRSNAALNLPLFRDISSYSFPSVVVEGDSATASGYVRYDNGGRSRVDASFVKEGGKWKLALLTMVYQ
jgi:hypothetical protein